MGRVSPSKQNQSGKNKPVTETPRVESVRRSRAQIRRSSSPAAIERATSGQVATTTVTVEPPTTVPTAVEAPVSTVAAPAPSEDGTRVNPNGVQQSGMDFRYSNPTLEMIEAYTGRTVANPFSSTNLQVDSPATDMMGRDADEAATIQDGGTVETTFEGGEITDVQMSPNPDAATAPAQSRALLLNAPDVMSGMKQAEAAQGLVFASGQYYVKNPNAGKEGEPELIPVRDSQAGGSSRQAIRDYKAGNMDAQTFFNDYVKDTKEQIAEADEPVTTPEAVEEVPDVEVEEEDTVQNPNPAGL